MSEKGLTLYDCIDTSKDKFVTIASNTGVDWERESMFAYQQLTANRYIMSVAQQQPDSIRLAMINVASVGLTLNPATSYAFLVPRDGAIRLDVSYRGLIKIATDTGSIKWAKAELVYPGDEFIYKGPAQAPEHNISNPFDSSRGLSIDDLLGVYCIAKTHDGDFLIETMTGDEIRKIRSEAKSMSSDKGKASSPWAEGNYPGEMAKKAVIKRASKTWPMSDQHERVQTAVDSMNEIDGSDWAEEKHRFKPGEKEQIITQMRESLSRGDSFGVIELVDEYSSESPDDYEESMKFWALFTSTERAAIHALMDDTQVQNERIRMGKPELNEAIEQ